MIAVVQIRTLPHYRRDAFVNGLTRAGYEVRPGAKPESKRDMLVVWNRYGELESMANRWEGDGGTVLVAENGYLSAGTQRYAIAVHGHNGSGWVPEGGVDRFDAIGVDLKPWRAAGDHVLVCGQRGIGSHLMASPPGWHHHTARALAKRTSHPIRIREHPGNKPPKRPLEMDLEGAHACVIWSSASGVKALTLGIPVLYAAPHWVAAAAAGRLSEIEDPPCDDLDRLRGLTRMAWSQWSVEEIDSGEPFMRILDRLQEAMWPQP